MGQADFYKHGDWNFICDVCGFKFKASEGRRRWDGVYVCKKDFESRHPQEKRRGIKDTQNVEWTRPESSEDSFELDGWSDIVSNEFVNGDVGDINTLELTVGISKQTQVYATPITANRIVRIQVTDAKDTDTFRIVQTQSVDFTIRIQAYFHYPGAEPGFGTLITIPAQTPTVVDVDFYTAPRVPQPPLVPFPDGLSNTWAVVNSGILI